MTQRLFAGSGHGASLRAGERGERHRRLNIVDEARTSADSSVRRRERAARVALLVAGAVMAVAVVWVHVDGVKVEGKDGLAGRFYQSPYSRLADPLTTMRVRSRVGR